MDNTKPGKTNPTKRSSASNIKAETQEPTKPYIPIPYAPNPLYFEIANSVHGKREKVIENKGESNERKVVKTELCEWQIPPVNKKMDCESHKCAPPPSYSSRD